MGLSVNVEPYLVTVGCLLVSVSNLLNLLQKLFGELFIDTSLSSFLCLFLLVFKFYSFLCIIVTY